MAGKQFTDLTKASALKDSDIIAVHDGNGLKKGLLSQLSNYMGTKFNNPNLLINPDFKINQREKSTYNSQYSVDRWKIYNALYNVSTKNLSNPNSSDGNLVQTFENPLNGTYTITVYCSSVTGVANFTFGGENVIVDKEVGDLKKGNNIVTIKATNLNFIGVLVKSGASVNIDYIKLEQGTVATPFVAPNPADELIKCQRHYVKVLGELRAYTNAGTSFGVTVNLPTKMRTKPTVNINNIYSYNVSSIETEIKNDNSAIFVYGTSKNQDSAVVDCIVMCDAEIY